MLDECCRAVQQPEELLIDGLESVTAQNTERIGHSLTRRGRLVVVVVRVILTARR